MLRLAVVAVALVATGGCGDSEARDEAARSQERTRTAHVSLEQEPATREETRWVGRVVDWALGIGEPLEVVASISAASAGATPTGEARAELEDALAEIADCSTALGETAGEAPSERLTNVADQVQAACEHFEAGAEAAKELLAGGGSAEALNAAWQREWEQASSLVDGASEAIVDYQPGNARDLPVRKGPTKESRVEPVFGTVTGELVDDEVEARCWSEDDWNGLVREMSAFTNGRIGVNALGFTGLGDDRVNLAPVICDGLVALHYRRLRPSGDDEELGVALAVGTLAHEAHHARGVVNEAAAECYGMQHVRDLARRLGADGAYADRLASVYWSTVYRAAPDVYRSRECRDGGRLDAHPDSSVWP